MSTNTLLCWDTMKTSDGNTTRVYFNITTDEWNFSYCRRCSHCPPLKADPDIAGIGVSIPFTLISFSSGFSSAE